MNDIINLNSIKSGSCDCNKPKKQPCGCGHKEPCYSTTSGDLYFKVKNLFSELKSEWQRAEARTNLGVTDIIKLDLIKYGKGSGDSNVWQMVVAKGGSQRVYDFVVNNGDSGESATIEIGDVYTTDETPIVRNVGSESHAILNFGIPKGKTGAKGDKGLSAYDVYVKNGGLLDEAAWLKSLKGEPGKPGDSGKDGVSGDLIKSVSIVDYSQYTKEFLDDKKITANMFIWRITLKDGRSFDFWIPEGTGGGEVVPVGKPTFLYKLVKFNSKPTSAELTSKLAELQNEVNKDSSGRTVEYLTENKGWRKTSFVLSLPGYEFIYLATSVITEDNVEPWVVTQLTGAQGEQGKEGPQGPSGTGGSDGQGLIGPVIRMRGTYIEGNCYVNLSQQAQQGTTIRFIDIVFHNNSYWKVSDNVTNCANGAPSDSNADWVKAVEFDFAYINTLIANYLKAYTIDANEIRIHKVDNWNNPSSDQIVAGMTSGKSVNTWETVSNTSDDPIRIWAGTNVDILDNDGENISYNLNLEDAKFKVRQSGKLEASDADIEGIVQANTLRLGELNQYGKGTFTLPSTSNPIQLPELDHDKILMFYILTNDSRLINPIEVSAAGSDSINASGTIANSFSAKLNKLYLLFGIHSVWYVVELDLVAASSLINPESNTSYGLKKAVIYPLDEWTAPTNSVNEYILQTLNIKGYVDFTFFNDTNATKTFSMQSFTTQIKYDAQAVTLNTATLTVPLLLANSVSYVLSFSALSNITVETGLERVVRVAYQTVNSESNPLVTVSNISYNGSLNNTADVATYSAKPDIGEVIPNPKTILVLLAGTTDAPKITLTNIPQIL